LRLENCGELVIFTKNNLMKRILTIALLAGMTGLFSCSNNSKNDNLTPPVEDTVSKGSYLKLSFNSKDFNITDISVNNSPLYTLTSTTIPTDMYDTLWSLNVVGKDFKMKQISLNLTASNHTDTGTYAVLTNGSTLSDFTTGQNKNYTIVTGSTVHISSTNGGYVAGELNLNLRYNYDSATFATGTFKIFK
jgi:hypothetical protein